MTGDVGGVELRLAKVGIVRVGRVDLKLGGGWNRGDDGPIVSLGHVSLGI